MRELTFKGYLHSQLVALSGVSTTSLYTFSQIAKSNARVKDTLVLYLVLYTNENLKNTLLNKYDYLNIPCKKLNNLNNSNFNEYLNIVDYSEFQTIYKNYLYAKNRTENENKIKLLMYRKIYEVKESKNITNYFIYKNLNLNSGNANAFLKYGDTSKVSLETVRRILAFVNEY